MQGGPFRKPTSSAIATPANIIPIMIEPTFAMNIGLLLVSLVEENNSRTKSGINIAEKMQVTTSN